MNVAIMQPYLFPYIGYFQLIAAADSFVLYDDIAYRKQSHINRNQILLSGQAQRISFPVANASSFRAINQHFLSATPTKVLRTVGQAYAKAPYRSQVMPLVEGIFADGELNVALLAERSLRSVCDYIGLERLFCRSSELGYVRDNASATEKVISICQNLTATHYINNLSGQALYKAQDFENVGIQLQFLQPTISAYPQNGGPFISHLSIMDALMFNAPADVLALCSQVKLFDASQLERQGAG